MKREAPMNIPEFATVLTAVMCHNMHLHDEGASIKDFLVPMAWGDPGLGKSDIAEAVADDLGWEMTAVSTVANSGIFIGASLCLG